MRDTDKDWVAIAETNPFWGILSRPEFIGHEISPELEESFFGLGETEMEALFAEIRARWPSFAPVRSLDFGCGAGRLLLPIARRSGQATGVDVAPRMLELARHYAEKFGAQNIELAHSDDDLSAVQGRFDFVHSFIVLQQITPARGTAYIRRLISSLNVGGIFAIHVSFAKRRDLMVHEMPAARYYRREGDVLRDLGHNQAHPTGTITMFDYDLNELFVLATEFTDTGLIGRLIVEDHLGLYLIGQRTIG